MQQYEPAAYVEIYTRVGKEQRESVPGGKVKLMFRSEAREGHFFSNRMPPVVGVNVVLEGQRCADELILGMSRVAWRDRSRVHQWSREGRAASFGKWVSDC